MVGSIIIAAITGVPAAAFTIGMTVAAAAINFAVSFVVNRAFAPDLDANQNTNNREQVPPTTDNAVPVVYGDAFLGGTFVDAVLSTDQKTMYYVLAISSISPNGQFTYDTTKFYYGGRLVTFGGSPNQAKVVSLTDDAGNVDTKIDDNLWIYLYTSSAAGTITPVNTTLLPNQVMTSTDLAAGFVWPASGRQMNGLAFAIVKLVYSQDDATTSLQPITFKVKHALNGTGVAKPGDVWYDYMTNTIYGAAVDAAYVDSASATTLNTYSDQTITYTPSGGGSTTQARYRINGVLSGNMSCLDNVDKILTACDTWMTYNAASGKWSLVVNKSETAAFAFNDTNIVGEIRVSATDITQSVNQIEARFPFKENKDQPNFVFLQTPAGLLYPNEPVNKMSVTYDLVNDSVQAQYLANRVLEQAREDLIVSFNTTYYGIQVDAGDVVSVTNADYGWSSKLFRVMKVNEVSLPDGNLGARLEMSEYSAAVYDDASITAYVPVPNSGLPSPQYFSALSTPVVSASRPNENPPTFDVQVTIPTTGRVTYGVLYYATTATPGAYDWKVLAQASTPVGTAAVNGATYTFLRQTLPVGTYYFSYIVGNEQGQSAKSSNSSAFNWSPLDVSGAITGLETDVSVLQIDVADKVSKTTANILTGTIVPENSGGIKVGTITWNSTTGALTGGSGIAITEAGIIGAKSGVASFSIDTSGNALFKGDINTAGDAYFAGDNLSTTGITVNGIVYNVDYSTFADATSNAASGSIVRAGVYGYAAATTSSANVGVIGYAPSSTKGYGVIGQSAFRGGYFISSNNAGIALEAVANSSTGAAFAIGRGQFTWVNTAGATSYTWPEPNGDGRFLRNDGTWEEALYQADANSGTATVNTSSKLSLLGATTTGIVDAYVGTSATGSTVTWTIQTTSPSDRRLKKDIEDSDLGLSFVKQLKPKKYKLKADPKQQIGYGFIADEVADLGVRDTSLVYFEPKMKVGEEEGFDTIHYPSYVAVLTKAIQELSSQVEELRQEIATLKNAQ